MNPAPPAIADLDPDPATNQIESLPEDVAAAEAVRMGVEDRSTGLGATVDAASDRMASGQPTTGGDPDAMQEQAKVVGEEAIGGTTPTPDQNNVDDIAAAVGIDPQPEQPLEVTDTMHERDDQRFELDPDSKGPAASTNPAR